MPPNPKTANVAFVKVLFKEIRAGDVEAVARRLDANPSLVDAIAKAPPKKDDGQSALQVAIKACQNEVAHLLLSRGADVNFVEVSSAARWPVLHDAVRGAIFSSRFGRDDPLFGIRNSAENFQSTFSVLKELIDRGADPNASDGSGNPPLMRAVLDFRQIAYAQMYEEFEQDLRQVFDLLLDAGADPNWIDARYDQPLLDFVAGTSLEPFLRRT